MAKDAMVRVSVGIKVADLEQLKVLKMIELNEALEADKPAIQEAITVMERKLRWYKGRVTPKVKADADAETGEVAETAPVDPSQEKAPTFTVDV